MFRIGQSMPLLLMGVFLAPCPDGAAGELKFIAPKPASVLDGGGQSVGVASRSMICALRMPFILKDGTSGSKMQPRAPERLTTG